MRDHMVGCFFRKCQAMSHITTSHNRYAYIVNIRFTNLIDVQNKVKNINAYTL